MKIFISLCISLILTQPFIFSQRLNSQILAEDTDKIMPAESVNNDEFNNYSEYVKIAKNGKKCLIIKGDTLLQPIFDEIWYDNYPDNPVVCYGGKWGILDSNMRYLAGPIYDKLTTLGPGLDEFIVSIGDKWGIVSEKGAILLNTEYEGIISINRLCSDIAGQNYILVKQSGEWSFYDISVNKFTKFSFDRFELLSPEFFYENRKSYLFKIEKNEKYGIVNSRGQIIIEPQYDEIDDIIGGMSAIREGNLWGFLDSSGALVIEPKFKSILRKFLGYTAIVETLEGEYVIIDEKGEIMK